MVFKSSTTNLCLITKNGEIKFRNGMYSTNDAREIELLRKIDGVIEEQAIKPLSVEAETKKKK